MLGTQCHILVLEFTGGPSRHENATSPRSYFLRPITNFEYHRVRARHNTEPRPAMKRIGFTGSPSRRLNATSLRSYFQRPTPPIVPSSPPQVVEPAYSTTCCPWWHRLLWTGPVTPCKSVMHLENKSVVEANCLLN